MTLAPLMDAPTPTAQREFPMRMLNARMWGNQRTGERDPRDPVKLGGCGRIVEGGHWVPVFDMGSRWAPGSLAVCGNALLCDYCGGREQAESRERWSWHFEDWQAGGGQLVHIRLSFAHGRGDDLAPMLDDLRDSFTALRKSPEWAAAEIVDWVRVLHIRWSAEAGFHPHYHVTGFIRPGADVDEVAMVDRLQAAWRDRVARTVGRKVSRRHGLFARVLTTSWRALYAWNWADRDDDHDDGTESRLRDTGTGDREHVTDRSRPLYDLAGAALNGDRQAWAASAELCRAMKGVPVVRCSTMLNTIWAAYQATQPELEQEELDAPMAVQVHANLWERARRRGVTELGLELGRTRGVDAMAGYWARALGCVITVTDELVPHLSARDGPTDYSLN